jgi:hypothetical protein
MRIYWVGLFKGDYLQSLHDELEARGVEVIWAHSLFLRKNIPRGVPIHMHWLEAYGTSAHMTHLVKEALAYYARRNTLLWTVHNLQPHDLPILEGRAFYRLMIPYFDYGIHLGPKSIAAVRSIYPVPSHQIQRVCRHHILPHVIHPQGLPPWQKQSGVWISLGRIRSTSDKLKLGMYVNQMRQGRKSLYVHRYPHMIQRKIFSRPFPKVSLLWQEAKWRWFDSQVHLNFGRLSVEELSAWLNGAERLLLPRTRHLNSGVVFLAAPFGIPIQVPSTGNIPWQLNQLGYTCDNGELYRPREAVDWADYQHKTISRWIRVYEMAASST